MAARTRIITEFLGEINGIEVLDNIVYSEAVDLIYGIEKEFNIDTDKDLISDFTRDLIKGLSLVKSRNSNEEFLAIIYDIKCSIFYADSFIEWEIEGIELPKSMKEYLK